MLQNALICQCMGPLELCDLVRQFGFPARTISNHRLKIEREIQRRYRQAEWSPLFEIVVLLLEVFEFCFPGLDILVTSEELLL